MSLTVIPSTTAGATGYLTVTGNQLPVLLFANNLAGAEEVTINISPDGTNWQTYKIAGTAQKLTATITAVAIANPARFQFVQAVTAGACATFANYGSMI